MFKVVYKHFGIWKDLSKPQSTMEDCQVILRETEHYDKKYIKHPPRYRIVNTETEQIFDEFGTPLR